MTFQQLQQEQQQAIAAKEPFNAELQAAKDKYAKDIAPIESGFLAKLEEYYDSTLLDSTGKTISVNDVVTDGKSSYKVTSRSLQALFGTLINNPRICCHMFKGDRLMKKEYDFGPKCCTEMTIQKQS